MSDDEDSISLPIAGDEEVAGSSDEEETEETGASDEPSGVLGAIDEEVTGNEVVLYMKGTPVEPMCGFSARASQLLEAYDVSYHAVNVLAEEEKREGIKEYGDWATIPQLYVDGELIGGSDILMKMHESGELADVFDDADVEFQQPG